jgi:hypothetical protein
MGRGVLDGPPSRGMTPKAGQAVTHSRFSRRPARRRFVKPSSTIVAKISTIAAKIAVHSHALPQSNPNISRFAQTVVVFWADSNGDLPVPFCWALLDKNKKTEAKNAPALR